MHGGFDGALYLTSLDSKKAFAITSEGLRPRDSADVSKLVYGSHPLYAATGHILYLSGGDGILMALPFDPGRQRVLGPPVPILGGIRQEAETGVGQLSMADDGTLVYAPGVNAGLSVPVWVEAGGHVDTLPFPRTHYGSFDLSRDGKQLLIRTIPASGKAELRVFDLDRGSQTLIATRGIPSFYPRWLAGATEVAFGEFTPEGGNVAPVLRQTPTAAAPETLSTAAETYEPSPDGRYLLVVHWRNAPGVWLLPLSGGSEQPVQLLPNDVTFPAFSPDGRWLAYTDRGQPPNIHVISLDRPEIPHRVSLAGGEEGLWSPQGDQIIYRNRQKWFAVDVSTRPNFQVGRPRLLFEGAYLNVAGWSHDISPDGRRHLFLLGSPEETTTHVVVVQNWFSELQRLAPPGRK